MKDIRYMLERYRPGGGNRYTCPFCGQKKCFARYINVDTGEYVDKTCGKCDHENSCSVVHYPPRDFFRDHPWMKEEARWEQKEINGSRTVLGMRTSRVSLEPKEFVQTEFFDFAWAEEARTRKSTFRTWFESLPFDKELIQIVLGEYFVGATQKGISVDGKNYGPAVVFWLIDEQMRVHDAKMMAYKEDGHRVQGWANSIRSICEKTKIGPQLWETEKVLFGLHLLNYYPQKTVCIVESEKTALVCACHYPEYLWLATGGCGNLKASKLRPLMNRNLIVFPDSGEYHKWKERMAESGHKHYHVIDFIEQYEPNTDIADIILGEAKMVSEKPL